MKREDFMSNLAEERKFKIDRIVEEYNKRKTQKEIAEMFGMNIKHVSWVTQLNNYKHTRKITGDNIREGKKINGIFLYEDEEYAFLDQYPIENFKK
jgi:hypothetical protein